MNVSLNLSKTGYGGIVRLRRVWRPEVASFSYHSGREAKRPDR
jgi:hypothetical protein